VIRRKLPPLNMQTKMPIGIKRTEQYRLFVHGKIKAEITHANHPNPDCTTGSRIIAAQRRKGTRSFACTCKQGISRGVS
jgi:hypothetical protein